MAQCELTDELIVKIGDDMADIIAEIDDGLSSADAKSKFKKLFESFNEYFPRQGVIKAITDVASDYGLMGDDSIFFMNDQEIENIIADGGKLNYVHEEDNTTGKLEEAERNRLAKDVKKDFLIKAYGTATDVRTKVEKQASVDLANAILINRLKGRTVSNIDELNQNIRDYQQKLLNKIVDYLKEYYKNSPSLGFDISKFDDITMYRADGKGGWEYTGIVEKLEPEIMKILSRDRFPDNVLERLFTSTEISDKNKLDAYNSWQLLSHFDSLIKIKYGKSLDIANFGDMVFTGENKYKRADRGANNKTSWRTTDEINLNEEVDNVIQELVNSTPLLNYGSDTQLGYLQFGDFSDILAKIKDLVFKGDDFIFPEQIQGVSIRTAETIHGQSFKGLINKIRLNPQKYLSAVFEVLSNPDIFEELYNSGILNDLTKSDKDIIYSIHKGITGSVEPNSINFINSQDLSSSIYSEIALACDSIYKINFLQYYKGLDGNTKVRNMSNTRLDGILRNLRLTLKTKNNRAVPGLCTGINDNGATIQGITITGAKTTVYDKYINPKTGKETTTSREQLNSIEFTIPNTGISVKVSLDGKVQYKRNGKQLRAISKGTDFDGVLSFINKITGQNITEETIKLAASRKQFSDEATALTSFACRSLFMSYVSNVELGKETTVSGMNFKLKLLFGVNAPRIDTNMRELDLIHSSDTNTLEELANAIAIEQGLYSSSQIKSGNGNSQSQQSLSRLLGSLHSQWELLNKVDGSATQGAMIMDTHIFRGIYTAKEYYDLNQAKEHTDFNVNEFATSMFMYDFIGGMNQTSAYGSLTGNGIIGLIPSVNSDKNTIGRILIDTNAEVEINGQTKRLRDLTSDEFEQVIAKELGTIYDRVIKRINQDFNSVLLNSGQSLYYTQASFDAFNEKHKILDSITGLFTGKYDSARALNEFVFNYNQTHRNAPISLTDQIHFIEGKDGSIQLNKTLLNFQDEFVTEPSVDGTLSSFHHFMMHKKADIIGSLLRSGFKVDLTQNTPETKYLLDKDNLDLSWIDTKHGQMIIGKVQIGGNVRTIRTKNDLNTIIQELRERVLPKVNHALVEATKIGDVQKVNKYTQLSDKLEKADILYNPQLLSDLEEFGVYLNLNPLIEQYNNFDYLFTQEFMITTVGTLAAHPVKGKPANVEEEEAGRFNAQHKRNVSYTATMLEFTLGMLNGIPSDYNIAVVDDIKDKQYNVTGEEDTVKPFDGATFVNPFIVYLENVSLGAAKAGITKKQFVHFYDEHTANGGIIKTCGFGLTNDWMRNSPLLQRMMLKMTSGKWFGPNGEPIDIDITVDYKGNNIQYDNIIFKKNGKYYQLTGIEKIQGIPNKYNLVGRQLNVETHPGQLQAEFKGASEEISLNDIFGDTTGVTVDSNYALWQLFGGKDSLTLDGTTLKPSETSIKNVVVAMNSIGVHPTTGQQFNETEASNVQTQDDIYQVLKHSDVHYAATAGAVKQGAANINKNSTYHDDKPYNFMKIHMYQAGIQLDKEHHADGSELSLMTQVINACAHRGYSLDDSMEMFNALRTLTDVGTSTLLEPIKEYVNIGDEASKTKVVEATVNTILKALSKQSLNESDLLSIFADELIQQIKTGATLKEQDFLSKLPIDNPAVYAKFMSSVSVFLTNSGIKMKIPGILSVLTPSYNIMKTYQVPYKDANGITRFRTCKWEQIENNEFGMSPQDYLNEILHYAPYVFQTINTGGINTPTYHWSNLRIGRSYEVHRVDGKVETIKIGTARLYKQMKQAISLGLYNSVQEDIREGRELGNYNVNFKGTPIDGVETEYSLYDLDSVQALFELKDILDMDYLSQGPALVQFNAKYRSMLSGSKLNAKQIEKELRLQVRRDTAILSPNGEEYFDGNSVMIDGKSIVVNKSTILTEAYELVLPKIFINEFGLDTNDLLDEIAENPEFFAERLVKNFVNQIDEGNFDICLKNLNGKHYYLAESVIGTQGLHEVNINKFTENGKLYRIDEEGNHIYELSSDKDKVYVDNDGNEIIVSDNLGFYIDHLHYSTIKISNLHDEEAFSEFAEIIKNSKNKSAKRYYKYITSQNISGNDLSTSNTSNANLEEQANTENVKAMMLLNEAISEKVNLEDLTNPLTAMLREIGHEMHSSFMKSLEVVASRTPSQSMQSFMPMKIVAFDNPNVNTAFVSTAQIWLLGSDY